MKAAELHPASGPSDGIWKALRPSPPTGGRPVEPETREELEQPSRATVNDIRRLMLQSREFRDVPPSANPSPAVKGNAKDIDRTIDTIFACLAICADEERRAISCGSLEGAITMQRSMRAIKEKFGIS